MSEIKFSLNADLTETGIYYFELESDTGLVDLAFQLNQAEVDNLFKAVNGYQTKETRK